MALRRGEMQRRDRGVPVIPARVRVGPPIEQPAHGTSVAALGEQVQNAGRHVADRAEQAFSTAVSTPGVAA